MANKKNKKSLTDPSTLEEESSKSSWKKHTKKVAFSFMWFSVGFILAAFFLTSFALFFFENQYNNRIYEGIYIDDMYVGGKTEKEVRQIFDNKNLIIDKSTFTLYYQDQIATVSAKELSIGYDSKLISKQAYSLGRSNDFFTNYYLIANAYFNGIFLHSSYTYSLDTLNSKVEPIQKSIYSEPVNALFTVENNRVVAFRQSTEGKTIDYDELNNIIKNKIPEIVRNKEQKNIVIQIPIKILQPDISTEKANNLGIVEIVGEGKSEFKGSIPNRVHNITLAASKLNGVLVAPGETFSFNDTVGDISKYTGYKEAYVIKDGKTVLGDGGGVCQVSTTLFRAILNAGLPVVERAAHSYRVGYYEQDSPPGIDATVFAPSPDLKFKNDMKNYILIQTFVDPTNLSLAFILYGKKDGREVEISTPVITSQTPAPDPLYQDDPTLPKGVVQQVDFAASGANVYFTRTVKKDGKIIINDKFTSSYAPWRAVFLRGTG